MDKEEFLETVWRGIFFTFGVFLLALCYNVFFLPNNLVIGGTSGIAIILNRLVGINPTIFIYIMSVILIIISYLVLGKEKTKHTVVGSLLYPLMISITTPIAFVISKSVVLDNLLLEILIAGVLYGVSNGLIYKSGFTTGGGDVIMQIVTKYFKVSAGKASLYSNLVIILIGGLTFGFVQVIYAIIILYISTIIIDKILIGISDSKVFYIFTRKSRKIKNMIINDLKAGYTVLPTIGGYSHIKGEMLMCVISTRDYYIFKEKVLEIDPEAFFVINDCYEVNGGVKKKNLPFI